MLRPALALGAVLAAGGYATAGDTKHDFGATTVSLVGKGTLADAAANADDTELTWGRGGYHGGYHGGYGRSYAGVGRYYGGYGRYYGGYGGRYYAGVGRYYGGYGRYYGGYGRYYGGYGRYYGGLYRPFYTSLVVGGYPYYGGFGSYYGGYGYPAYYSSYYGSYSVGYGYSDPCYYGGYVGISGGAVDVSTPALSLTLSTSRSAPTQRVITPVMAPASGTLRYDTPATSLPAPESVTPSRPAAPVAADEIPVSLKAKAAAKPFTYKAYGEK